MEEFKSFAAEETGVTTVEIILILVVLIALVLIFQKQITQVVNDVFQKITTGAGQVHT